MQQLGCPKVLTRRLRTVQLTDLTRVYWQQLSVTELVEVMKTSPDHAAAMYVAAVRVDGNRCRFERAIFIHSLSAGMMCTKHAA